MSITPFMIRRVQGHSMVPVLPPGTLVIAVRWFRMLRPDRVIIFERQNREIVKRIDHLTSNGLYVLGDHPETSTDSREYGPIPSSSVLGVVVWPHTAKVMAAEYDSKRSFSKRVTRQKDSEA